MSSRLWLPSLLLVLPHLAIAASGPELSFNQDIRPILSENCFYCHGQDPKHREADLRLDTREGATRDLGGYSAIVPGNPEKSELIKRLLTHEKDDLMPPKKSNRHVSPEQIATLKRWIQQGAIYQNHWAYLPPQRASLPTTQNVLWSKQPMDRFVLARLEKESLKPSPEASPETWLRRASLDLTGLPPSPQEIDAFIAETANRGESAYNDATDRLLKSKHFGERLAIDWLDTARYADTHGFNNDSSRSMWRWRDWVINAFNSNLPYDRFITEQLAGDLLPKPTLEQRIATGFSRNHVINSEGGIIDEEYRVEYVADRVRTMSTAWLGLTTECSRCHDHKYDPITQRDYYRFFSFFNNVPEYGEDGRIANAVPMIPAPTEAQQRLLATQKRTLEDLDTQIAEASKNLAPDSLELERVLKAAKITAGTLKNCEVLEDAKGDGKRTARKLDFGSKEGVSLSFWLRSDSQNPGDVPLLSALNYTGSPADAGYGRGRELRLIDGELEWRDSSRFPVYARVIRTEGAGIQPGQWHQVTLALGSGKSSAQTRFFLNGVELPTRILFDGGGAGGDSTFLVGRDNSTAGTTFVGEIEELRFYPTALSGKETLALAFLGRPKEANTLPDSTRRLLALETNETTRILRETRNELWEKHLALKRSLPTAMVMQEMPQPRPAFVLTRGNYDAHGEPVSAGVPEFIAPWPKQAPANRLGLAQWFTSPQHPLTSRVVVNRFWAQLFGVGLVKTLEDFGSQGEWPSHPELLDWLAREFVDGGWDVKALFKQIVLSATYRQSSAVTPELVAKDPENRLLARGPRVRLPAEVIRDQALAISGLLAPQIGGPSVFPYQPEKLYEGIVVAANYPGTKWEQNHGDSLYRRSLYTFWKRTVTHPAMLTFDAPDREFCTVRRSRTNTPLQALLLWNEPGYLESARVLGTRMLKEGGPNATAQVAFGFRLATGRAPTNTEIQTLLTTLEKLRTDFAAHPADAEAFLKVGESPLETQFSAPDLAAAMGVANLLLNLDETITKN